MNGNVLTMPHRVTNCNEAVRQRHKYVEQEVYVVQAIGCHLDLAKQIVRMKEMNNLNKSWKDSRKIGEDDAEKKNVAWFAVKTAEPEDHHC